jgi:ech hydrogenase subunit D
MLQLEKEHMTPQTIIDITIPELLGKVRELQGQGFRLVQICCSRLPDKLEMHYSFDLDYQFTSLRLTLLDTEKPVPSVSGICFPAFLYENEIHDLYGVKIEGMAIDFKGNFYQKTMVSPFNPPAPAAKSEGEAKP